MKPAFANKEAQNPHFRCGTIFRTNKTTSPVWSCYNRKGETFPVLAMPGWWSF
jgi:hypothetical protein